MKIGKTTTTTKFSSTPIPISPYSVAKKPPSVEEDMKSFLEKRERAQVNEARLAQVTKITEQERLQAAQLRKERENIEGGGRASGSSTGQAEKYSVDTANGAIRVATKDEPNPLSYEEAKRLSDEIKAGIEKREATKARTERRGVFTMGATGGLQVVEGATMTAEDVAVMQAVQKAQEGGDKRSAIDILEEELKRYKLIEEFRGGTAKPDLLDDADRLLKLKALFGGDEETKTLLKGILQTMTEGSKQGLTEIKGQVASLQEQLLKKDREVFETKVLSEIASIKQAAKEEAAGKQAVNEYGIMQQGLTSAVGELKGLRQDARDVVQTVMSRRPSPLTPEQRKVLTTGITEEVRGQDEISKLGHALFSGARN